MSSLVLNRYENSLIGGRPLSIIELIIERGLPSINEFSLIIEALKYFTQTALNRKWRAIYWNVQMKFDKLFNSFILLRDIWTKICFSKSRIYFTIKAL